MENEIWEPILSEKKLENTQITKYNIVWYVIWEALYNLSNIIDVNKMIESSKWPDDSKMDEKPKALDARKFAFGSHFHHVPP